MVMGPDEVRMVAKLKRWKKQRESKPIPELTFSEIHVPVRDKGSAAQDLHTPED